MSVAAPARPVPARREPSDPRRPPRSTARAAGRVALAVLALLAVYATLSFLDDPRGTLGTDTGGKLATVHAMQRHHSLDPDVGYWAERFDPLGRLHPLYYTRHMGDRWVNATTLPMLDLGYPLAALGGDRALLLLPMLGSALAALAARALGRRLAGGRAGWWAFWTVGLASPLALYALDFWEHSLGVALVCWAVVAIFDVVDERAGWRGALVAGLLLGAASSMRTDALVYSLVIAAVAAVVVVHRRRRLAAGLRLVAPVAAGLALVLGANQLLERLTAGGSIRAGRAADKAASAGAGLSERVHEALTTTIGLNHWTPNVDWLLGGATAALVAYAAWRLTAADRRSRGLGAAAAGAAALLYATRLSGGLGFVPGMLTASPLAAAGVAIGWRGRPAWRVLAIALGALPLIWFAQYSGGAGPQWGGRYVLVSGTLLVVAAAIALATAPAFARVVLIALAVGVTACGVGWLSERSHSVATFMVHLDSRHDEVVVSQEAHLLREGGAFYTPQRHWLTAVGRRELSAAFRVARDSGAHEVALVGAPGEMRPAELAGFQRQSAERTQFLPGYDVRITTYSREGT